ncbi:MAG TPA: host attachment protein [Noviherbaspirillum sp.]|jgi:protein required for attachment to host cells|uniref:host attachment protein n=1 Tax=Noviherbaspirillum sp. TaxID=1926288 RepID=UPI002F921327
MGANWIVSANASRARIFSQDTANAALQEIDDMVNEGARLRTQDMENETDKIGPTSGTKSMHNTGGAVPNKQYEPPVTPDKQQAELFARDLAEYLLKARRDGRFDQLSLVISPQFLGAVRKLLDAEVESAVKLEINKDYTHFGAQQLLEHIQAHNTKH